MLEYVVYRNDHFPKGMNSEKGQSVVLHRIHIQHNTTRSHMHTRTRTRILKWLTSTLPFKLSEWL